MELQLKNIGMIKEANVKIDGLTVIAGENDTGKSTLGKALYCIFEGLPDIMDTHYGAKTYEERFPLIVESVFKEKYDDIINFENSSISLSLGNDKASYSGLAMTFGDGLQDIEVLKEDLEQYLTNIYFIETPLVWNLQEMFKASELVESYMKSRKQNIEMNYPFLMKDLYFSLSTKLDELSAHNTIKKDILNIMRGEFKEDEDGIYHFYKSDKVLNLTNVATGIKSFGIIQVLIDNNRLTNTSLIIFDEPEVHLHPKWQLEMAKVIVELVKNGVKVLVNSHSPYMIEALKRYSEIKEQEDKTNFYLAENGYIKQINNSNSETLVEVFEKLSEPFDTFEQMDADSLGKLING
jgi:predicted ATPase